jgi:hypothetical protein
MRLSEVSAPALQRGWPAIEALHRSAQSCVKDVDLDLNPASPFGPRRRLGWQR